ncbi:hypothetical protein DSAG12_02207 [Promethearchaeum syntrophicum]|uniref:Uncharacterized protein n=1 Tax=Promethearchaeum syntrophicum TaxID=2594042 RepID=A0A5B9DBZ3_9ARCH|nr:hypothetical protein [Candidatus Prometheoarchaeum syntrophicum]QEE16377.1 hypothetical protein DSAG12_02207 [Candidatus Prometheoarchaeum syntrophicum]
MSEKFPIEKSEEILLDVYYKLGLDDILNEQPKNAVIDTRDESELIDIFWGFQKETNNLRISMYDKDIKETTKYVAFNFAHEKMDFIKKKKFPKKKILLPLFIVISSIFLSIIEYSSLEIPIFIKILLNILITAFFVYYIKFIYVDWRKYLFTQFEEVLRSIKSEVGFTTKDIEEYAKDYDWKEYIFFPIIFLIGLLILISWLLMVLPP